MPKHLSEYGLHHVGYVVKDLEVTLSQLEKSLGPLERQIYDFKPSKAWCYGKPAENYQLKIAMVTLGSGTAIEVIQPVSEGMHMDAAISQGGIHHVCFAVTGDYGQWRRHFLEMGFGLVFESETEDEEIGYRRCFYAEDQAGNIVEVKETPYFRTEEEKREGSC